MSTSDFNGFNRKTFLKKLGLASAAVVSGPFIMGKGKSTSYQLEARRHSSKKISPNDHVNLGLIGAGGMGQGNIATALQYDGFKIVAACDLYDSRLTRCKERFGEDIFTTMDYLELLDRDDVDAVVIGSTDHWHDLHAIHALEKGKPVYLEKPITQTIDEAHNVIETEQRTGTPLIIGSQWTSSIIYEKVRELYLAGEIGELNYAEGYTDRFTPRGAWQYSIPPNATTENVDWETFRKDLPNIPFDPKHFFRWRNYDDYGTGVAGDLFVHHFSGMHMILNSKGPDNIYATGELRYWKDGRDAEDVVLGLFDYPKTENHPAFNMSLRVNFADGSGGGSSIRLVGSGGEIQFSANNLILRKSKMPDEPGMRIGDFSEATRNDFEKHYRQQYPEQRANVIEPGEFEYRAPAGYNARFDHFMNFYRAIREGQKVLQDGTFGLRAAGPALLASDSLRENKPIRWDPAQMRVL